MREVVLPRYFRIAALVTAVLSFTMGYGLVQISGQHTWFAAIWVGLSGCAAAYLVYSRATKRGRRSLAADVAADAVVAGTAIVMLVGVCTSGFAATSVLLYQHGVGTMRGGQPEGTTLGDAAFWYYLWHLASSVPLLEIPKTLNWKLRYSFTDHVHGSFLLAYKLAVIIPLLDLARYIVGRWVRPVGSEDPAAAAG
jgi:hypothetical protein